MNTPKIAAYGSWQSPITSEMIVSKNIGFAQVIADRQANKIYWLEARPLEAGRNVIVQYDPETGKAQDITPKPFNVRTKVHEYGGGAFRADNNTIFFTDYQDQQIYKQIIGQQPQAITKTKNKHYADLIIDRSKKRLICVCQDHSKEGKVKNYILSISLNDGAETILTQGEDFYSSIQLSPDNNKLVWLSWNNPDMPWDHTRLSLANIDQNGDLKNIKQIAGDKPESIFQPQWLDKEKLCFISDRSNWWNFYSYSEEQIKPILEMSAEFGLPQWVFGMSTYAIIDNNNLITAVNILGKWHIAKLDIQSKQLKIIESEYCNIDSVTAIKDKAVYIASTSNKFSEIVAMTFSGDHFCVLKKSTKLNIHPGYYSVAQSINFKTNDQTPCQAFYYPPFNKDFSGPEEGKPPLLVISHGGPTAAANAGLNLKIQYWTSRGFAVVDVNYTGSTGFGRKFRHQLYGQWGIADVNDCIQAAEFLAQEGLVDEEALAIRGSSAGGFTTLAALTFSKTFKTGASYYGVSDLAALTKETHKFEAHYLDKLIGPYPEKKELYNQRSPIFHTDKLDCPIIFFQGLEDNIVPPDQAEKMVKALEKKGLGVAYITFAQEGHGFRKSENIKNALDWELYFYSKVFSFNLPEDLKLSETWRLKNL